MNETPPTPPSGDDSGFQDLGLQPTLLTALERLELDAPTEIQTRMIPAVLDGKDCLARASTGAGKTNAYLLPIFQRVASGEQLRALVVLPTRSLAMQLERNLRRFAPEHALQTAVLGGRNPGGEQPDVSADAADVLIATPRGVCDLIHRRRHDWSRVGLLVIDEVDAILDERGPNQLREIQRAFEHAHQTILLTGSLNDEVRALAEELLHDPVEIDVAPGAPRAASAEHGYFAVSPQDKFDVLLSLCKQQSPRLALVFAASAEQARELARRLDRARVSCRWIGAPRRPPRRDQGARRERRARSEVIVANDPAPRRLSTIPASHLLHYELPAEIDTYMRRLEQTPRLRKNGFVIAFVEPGQRELLAEIERRLDKPFNKLETPQRPERKHPEQKVEHEHDQQPSSVEPPSASEPGGRLNEALRRDKELDARGLRPLPRTLGSRFRSTRRGKPLRRPGPPK